MGDITIVNQLLTGGYWRVLPDRPMAMLGELCQLRMHVDPWTAELWGSGNILGSWQKTLFLAYHLEVCMAQIYLHHIYIYIYVYIYIFWHSLCSGPGPAHSARSSQCEVRRGAGTQVDEKRIEARRRRRKRRRSCTFVRNLEALTWQVGSYLGLPANYNKAGLIFIVYMLFTMILRSSPT